MVNQMSLFFQIINNNAVQCSNDEGHSNSMETRDVSTCMDYAFKSRITIHYSVNCVK